MSARVRGYAITTVNTSGVMPMPTIVAGDLLLADYSCTTTPTLTSGWTRIGNGSVTGLKFETWGKVAAGSDTLTISGGTTLAGTVYSIKNWSGNISDIGYQSTTGTMDPPSITMPNAGNLVVASACATAAFWSTTSDPDNSTLTIADYIDSGHTKGILSSFRETDAATVDPGAGTGGSVTNPAAWTVAVPAGDALIPTILYATTKTGNAGSYVANVVTGSYAGDIHEVRLHLSGSATVSSAPSGWTLITNTVFATTRRLYCYQRICGDNSGESSATFTFSSAQIYSAHEFLIRNASLAGPYDGGFQLASSGTAATSIPAPSVTPTLAKGLLICTYHVMNTATTTTFTDPTGMVRSTFNSYQHGDGTNGVAVTAYREILDATGATGTRTAVASASGAYAATSGIYMYKQQVHQPPVPHRSALIRAATF